MGAPGEVGRKARRHHARRAPSNAADGPLLADPLPQIVSFRHDPDPKGRVSAKWKAVFGQDHARTKSRGNIGGIWPFCSYADESHTCHFLRVAGISRFRAGAGAADTVDARAANRAARAGSAAKLRPDG